MESSRLKMIALNFLMDIMWRSDAPYHSPIFTGDNQPNISSRGWRFKPAWGWCEPILEGTSCGWQHIQIQGRLQKKTPATSFCYRELIPSNVNELSFHSGIQVTLSSSRADSRFAPSQWETALLSNDVFHWLGANLESALWLPIDNHFHIHLGKSMRCHKFKTGMEAEIPTSILFFI